MAAVRAKGDKALFGGHTTQKMKHCSCLSITNSGPLADYLPTLSIAETLVNEMTKLHLETKDVQGEILITDEHVPNSKSERIMLGNRGIQPESRPPAEDVSKVERRRTKDEKQIVAAGVGEVDGF
jgi:DNA-damage-inducible protein D